MKKVFIITGEASGDIHAANLVREIEKRQIDIEIQCWGGEQLSSTSAIVKKDIKELAFMGFIEVLMNLRTILKNIKLCKQQILDFKPDVLLLVDYPGFNLRIAEWAKSNDIKTCYYIAPQAWAWKRSRVHKMKKVIDKLLVLLPFEEGFFRPYDINTTYVGHPLLDELVRNGVKSLKTKDGIFKNKLALLPGSRKQEIKKMLPTMLEASKKLGFKSISIAKASTIEKEFIDSFCQGYNVSLQNMNDSLIDADFALVSSGTATLETALYGVPQIVCYKGNNISYQIAKRVVKLDYISLVNLIANDAVIPELIQNDFKLDNILEQFEKISSNISKLNSKYALLWDTLKKDSASKNAVTELLSLLNN